MSVTLTVPAPMVAPLRRGLHHVVGNAAASLSEISATRGHVQHPGWYRAPLESCDSARALLDLIGWADPEPEVAVTIDVHEHGPTAQSALASALSLARSVLQEIDLVDAERAKAGQPACRIAVTEHLHRLRELLSRVEHQLASIGSAGQSRSHGVDGT